MRARIPWAAGPGLLLVLAATAGAARAADYAGTPGNYRSLLRRLKPGDRLVLAPGEYTGGLSLSNLQGAEGRPIVIEGPAKGAPAVFPGRGGHNTVQINKCSYLTIRNIQLDGRNISSVHAVDARGGGHHVTLERITVVNHGRTQQTCGVAANDGRHYWNWVIRDCTFIGAGTGMYLGTNSGAGGFSTALIEGNVILDTVGYCIEFKVQSGRAAEVPEGSSIVRHNVFSKLKSESGGRDDGARPNLLVDPFPKSGRGSKDIYLVYGNFFYQNYESDALFQGTGNIAFYNNLLVNERGSKHAVHIQGHNGKNRKIRVFFNTIVAEGNGIRVSSTEGDDQHVFANAVFAGRPLGLARGVKGSGNATGSYKDAAANLAAPFAPLGELDLRPKPGTLAGKEFDTSLVEELPDWRLDFCGEKRTHFLCGAYAGADAERDWKLARAPKEVAAPAPPVAEKPKPLPKKTSPAPPSVPKPPPPPRKPPTPDETCRGWLSLALSYKAAGRKDKAREYLKKIIETYPGNTHADRARRELAKL